MLAPLRCSFGHVLERFFEDVLHHMLVPGIVAKQAYMTRNRLLGVRDPDEKGILGFPDVQAWDAGRLDEMVSCRCGVRERTSRPSHRTLVITGAEYGAP